MIPRKNHFKFVFRIHRSLFLLSTPNSWLNKPFSLNFDNFLMLNKFLNPTNENKPSFKIELQYFVFKIHTKILILPFILNLIILLCGRCTHFIYLTLCLFFCFLFFYFEHGLLITSRCDYVGVDDFRKTALRECASERSLLSSRTR